jgi:hypothetical protein
LFEPAFGGVVPCPNQAYFKGYRLRPMEQSGNVLSSQRFASRPVIVVAAVLGGLLLAGTLLLWAHYGGAVFYEMILAGIAACF